MSPDPGTTPPAPAATLHRRWRTHPLHAILLAFPIALFTGALLADVTYLNSAEVQWTNFAAWLITFAEVFGGFAALWALIELVRYRHDRSAQVYFGCVAVMWLLGLVNAFQHSRDGWSSVGTGGLILSLACTALALVAGWIAYSDREIAR